MPVKTFQWTQNVQKPLAGLLRHLIWSKTHQVMLAAIFPLQALLLFAICTCGKVKPSSERFRLQNPALHARPKMVPNCRTVNGISPQAEVLGAHMATSRAIKGVGRHGAWVWRHNRGIPRIEPWLGYNMRAHCNIWHIKRGYMFVIQNVVVLIRAQHNIPHGSIMYN
jgi:hypothetical protein